MLCSLPTATEPWDPAVSPTKERRRYAATTTCFRRLVRNASCKERQATFHEASVESVSRQALAGPGSFVEQRATSPPPPKHHPDSRTLPLTRPHCERLATWRTQQEGTMDRSFSCRPPREAIVKPPIAIIGHSIEGRVPRQIVDQYKGAVVPSSERKDR
jgi:hypothetical protein